MLRTTMTIGIRYVICIALWSHGGEASAMSVECILFSLMLSCAAFLLPISASFSPRAVSCPSHPSYRTPNIWAWTRANRTVSDLIMLSSGVASAKEEDNCVLTQTVTTYSSLPHYTCTSEFLDLERWDNAVWIHQTLHCPYALSNFFRILLLL